MVAPELVADRSESEPATLFLVQDADCRKRPEQTIESGGVRSGRIRELVARARPAVEKVRDPKGRRNVDRLRNSVTVDHRFEIVHHRSVEKRSNQGGVKAPRSIAGFWRALDACQVPAPLPVRLNGFGSKSDRVIHLNQESGAVAVANQAHAYPPPLRFSNLSRTLLLQLA